MNGIIDSPELTQLYLELRNKMDDILTDTIGMEELHRIDAIYRYHTELKGYLNRLNAVELKQRAEIRIAEYMGEK